MDATNKILIIATNVGDYEKVGFRTGLWLGELTHFWDVAEKAGFKMDIASPSGGYIPIAPESLTTSILMHRGTGARYTDRAFMDRLRNTPKVSDVEVADYDAVYLAGGHGACFDFPKSKELAELIAQFYENGKVVSAVCHGPAGLLEVKLSNGEYLIAGKNVTGFSWKEELAAGTSEAVPFNLEEELKKRGAHYSKALLGFAPHTVEHDHLVTGQNPGSALYVGKAVIKKLREAVLHPV